MMSDDLFISYQNTKIRQNKFHDFHIILVYGIGCFIENCINIQLLILQEGVCLNLQKKKSYHTVRDEMTPSETIFLCAGYRDSKASKIANKIYG